MSHRAFQDSQLTRAHRPPAPHEGGLGRHRARGWLALAWPECRVMYEGDCIGAPGTGCWHRCARMWLHAGRHSGPAALEPAMDSWAL